MNLKRLRKRIVARKHQMAEAVAKDFGRRAPEETWFLEILPLLREIDHAVRHIEDWMQPEPESWTWTPSAGESVTVFQPLGVIGVIGSWNYPYYVSLSPVISAIAAGNDVMLKPSELAPASAGELDALAREAFPEGELQVVQGDAALAAEFASLPFDHLFFTGSTRVGKSVMKSAAANLVPVTLELGGKCPAIVGEKYSLRTAAERIWTGKLVNAGQTCLAPDYVMVPASRVDEFVEISREVVRKLYPDLAGNSDYTQIVNDRQYERLMGMVTDALERGAQCILPHEGESLAGTRILAPILLLGGTDEMTVMQEEIFGPILPLVPYETLDDAIRYVQARPRALALYYFDRSSHRIEKVLQSTISGGVTINDVIFHIGQPALPFGGTGQSGMGRAHGIAGFRTFSNVKAVFRQSRLPLTALLRPPYGRVAQWLAKLLLRG